MKKGLFVLALVLVTCFLALFVVWDKVIAQPIQITGPSNPYGPGWSRGLGLDKFYGISGIAAGGQADEAYIVDSGAGKVKQTKWRAKGAIGGFHNEMEFGDVSPTAIDNITFYQGKLYVPDRAKHSILVFNAADGRKETSIGSRGESLGYFNMPSDIAFDSEGNYYVADTLNNRIQKFNSAGNFQEMGSFPYMPVVSSDHGYFISPNGVLVNSDGNIWVNDPGDKNHPNKRIQVFSPGPLDDYYNKLPKFIIDIKQVLAGAVGIDVNRLNTVSFSIGRIANDSNGKVYAVVSAKPENLSGWLNRILVLNADGSLFGSITEKDIYPKDVAVFPKGEIWATAQNKALWNCIKKYQQSDIALPRFAVPAITAIVGTQKKATGQPAPNISPTTKRKSKTLPGIGR